MKKPVPQGFYEKRAAREDIERRDLDEALLAWVTVQTRNNAQRLYAAGCTYLGVKKISE